MTFLLDFEFPVEQFNEHVRNGTAGEALNSVIESIKPEAVYFCARNGRRGGTMVVQLESASQIPSIAEPLFLKFGAKIDLIPAITVDEMGKAGLDEVGKKWS